ncbi:MAG: FAD-dependent oxidoreductase [Candidatus Lokiarchaeota archaeon]|nr:FAD-dependent oxidoreductase [Candidatus Lokiarchaeota archaeon]
MKHIIIGAGPAGLSAAYNLARHDIGSLVLEKESQIGGLAKTLEYELDGGTYRTDTGPHRFFSQNPALYKLIEELLGPDWVVVDRLTRQLIDGKYFNYPVDIVQALRNVNPFVAIKMMLDFVQATARKVLSNPKVVTFEDFVVLNFGRRLGQFNMLNYTEKIWGIPCSRIAASWAGQRIKGMNAFDIVKKALLKSGGPRSMVDSFYYPKRGIQEIYDKMAEFAASKGSRIEKEVAVTRIVHGGGLITAIEYEQGGKAAKEAVQNLISSMPITDLVKIMDPPAPASVVEAADSLGYRDQVQVFLIVDKPHITKDTWIYFPTTPPTFGRVMEPKNWYPTLSPRNRSSLLAEYFVFKGDKLWFMPDELIIKKTVHELEWLGFMKPNQLLKGWVRRHEKSYPMWDITYKHRLDKLTGWLKQFSNLYCIGRNGRYFYNNQDHSIETGLLAAQSIVDGKKYDLDNIGMENTYFEAGMLYARGGK